MQDALDAHPSSVGQVPARVIRQERASFWLDTGTQHIRGETSGRLKHTAESGLDRPIVGDWVLIAAPATNESNTAVISGVLPRQSVLLRRRVGTEHDVQPLAANVDVALVVVGLDREPNLGLIERAVLMARAGRIVPCVVLSKIDLCPEWSERVEQVSAHFPELQVIGFSALQARGADAVTATIGPGRSAVLIGPSGVGKSSLVNFLLGSEVMKTGAVRADDLKGKHTTTHRQLVRLPGGGLLIDGPGIRELGIWGQVDAVASSFPDVLTAASRCAQRGCQHASEPGCAVQEEVRLGTLDAARVEACVRLTLEIAGTERPSRGRRHTRPR